MTIALDLTYGSPRYKAKGIIGYSWIIFKEIIKNASTNIYQGIFYLVLFIISGFAGSYGYKFFIVPTYIENNLSILPYFSAPKLLSRYIKTDDTFAFDNWDDFLNILAVYNIICADVANVTSFTELNEFSSQNINTLSQLNEVNRRDMIKIIEKMLDENYVKKLLVLANKLQALRIENVEHPQGLDMFKVEDNSAYICYQKLSPINNILSAVRKGSIDYSKINNITYKGLLEACTEFLFDNDIILLDKENYKKALVSLRDEMSADIDRLISQYGLMIEDNAKHILLDLTTLFSYQTVGNGIFSLYLEYLNYDLPQDQDDTISVRIDRNNLKIFNHITRSINRFLSSLRLIMGHITNLKDKDLLSNLYLKRYNVSQKIKKDKKPTDFAIVHYQDINLNSPFSKILAEELRCNNLINYYSLLKEYYIGARDYRMLYKLNPLAENRPTIPKMIGQHIKNPTNRFYADQLLFLPLNEKLNIGGIDQSVINSNPDNDLDYQSLLEENSIPVQACQKLYQLRNIWVTGAKIWFTIAVGAYIFSSIQLLFESINVRKTRGRYHVCVFSYEQFATIVVFSIFTLIAIGLCLIFIVATIFTYTRGMPSILSGILMNTYFHENSETLIKDIKLNTGFLLMSFNLKICRMALKWLFYITIGWLVTYYKTEDSRVITRYFIVGLVFSTILVLYQLLKTYYFNRIFFLSNEKYNLLSSLLNNPIVALRIYFYDFLDNSVISDSYIELQGDLLDPKPVKSKLVDISELYMVIRIFERVSQFLYYSMPILFIQELVPIKKLLSKAILTRWMVVEEFQGI